MTLSSDKIISEVAKTTIYRLINKASTGLNNEMFKGIINEWPVEPPFANIIQKEFNKFSNANAISFHLLSDSSLGKDFFDHYKQFLKNTNTQELESYNLLAKEKEKKEEKVKAEKAEKESKDGKAEVIIPSEDNGLFDPHRVTEEIPDNPKTCKAFRLDQNGGAFEHIPVTEQAYGNCYAHAAVNLIDAYRFTHGDTQYDHLTSSLMASIEHRKLQTKGESYLFKNKDHLFNPIEGGASQNIIKHVIKHGSCNRNYIGINIEQLPQEEAKSWMDAAISIFRELKSEFNSALKKNESLDLDEIFNSIEERVCEKYPLSKIFHSEIINNLRSMKDIQYNMEFQDFLKKIIPCDPGHRINLSHIPQPKIYQIGAYPPSIISSLFFKKIISGRFSSKIKIRQPVSIGFNVDIIKDLTRENEKKSWVKFKDWHEAVIIGRRFSHGKCQWLIQNSWGDKGGPLMTPKGVIFEKGKYWIDVDLLAKNINAVTFIP